MPGTENNISLFRGNGVMIKNKSISVKQRLKNIAKKENKPFSEVLQYFAMERFLYRLSLSPHRSNFILKGALMLVIWDVPNRRVTMDIDMLGKKTSNEEVNVKKLITEVLLTNVDDDGLVFDKQSLVAIKIKEESEYSGIRLTFKAYLDSARIQMRIDVGFGDIVYPEPQLSHLPTFLDLPEPHLYVYSKETVVAEKLEAMIKLGQLNSRMKDFYDIWLLSRQYDFDGDDLTNAVKLTFTQRGTELRSSEIEVFSDSFSELKQQQWLAFHKKLNVDFVPNDFSEITMAIRDFLLPVIQAVSTNSTYPKVWHKAKSWD